jgi:hypothetical protein
VRHTTRYAAPRAASRTARAAGEYAILKSFAAAVGVDGAPGLDLSALDTAAIASGYGVASVSAARSSSARWMRREPNRLTASGAARDPRRTTECLV